MPNTPYFIWKYEAVFSLVLLAVQYFIVSFFPELIGREAEEGLIYLWFFDIWFTIPIIIIFMMPFDKRKWLMITILLIAAVVFYLKGDFNSLYVNTFISIILSNKFLFEDAPILNRDRIISAKGLRFLLAFGLIPIVVFVEMMLDKMGLVTLIPNGDGYMMSGYGKCLFFSGFYLILAALEYRWIKKASMEKGGGWKDWIMDALSV